MRFRLLLFIGMFAVASSAFAVEPQFWKVSAPEEFLSGELDGMMVNSRGEMRPGPRATKLVSFSEPFVLSQTTDSAGNRFVGTGNDGKVYRMDGTTAKVLFTASEPEIYAITSRSGSLYVASSPNGKIYKVDPKSGASSVFYDPGQAYIWALEWGSDGSLYAATGTDGKVFRISEKGAGTVFYDAPETHIRSIARWRDGHFLLGGSGDGRIYDVDAGGHGRALYDSALTEISSIYYDEKSEVAWAAGVTNVLPSAAPAKTEKPKGGSASASTDKKQADASQAQPTATVEVSFGYDDSSSTAAAQTSTAASELYSIQRDGFVEVARKFDREIIYAITGANNGGVSIATGPAGRIYRYANHELALVATVPEKQIVSVASDASSLLVTTTNSGAIYRVGSDESPHSEYRSSVKDAERFSKFGAYQLEGDALDKANLQMSFRSGNTSVPDATWSDWVTSNGPTGEVKAPPARFVQFKVDVDGAVPAGMHIDSFTLAYVNRNVAPVIESFAVDEPGVVYVNAAYPASPQVLEATNPDEYGIFTSLDNPKDKNEQGKRLYRKGYRTVMWKSHDDNGDTLRYSLFFRKKGTTPWLRLRENLDESQINFDTGQFPDGRYELRLVASDALANPEAPLTDSREALDMIVDNAPPQITTSTSGDSISIRATDTTSPIRRAEYAIDAQKWMALTPVDGVADSSDETFVMNKKDVEGHFVVIRIIDSFFNVSTASVDMR